MNETLQNSLIEIIKESTSSIKSGISFLQSEIPDVINQLLVWKFYQNLTISILSLIFVILLSILLYKIFSNRSQRYFWEKNKWIDYMEITGLGFTISMLSVSGIIGLVVTFLLSTFNVLQIYIAPKIFLIEYASQLVK